MRRAGVGYPRRRESISHPTSEIPSPPRCAGAQTGSPRRSPPRAVRSRQARLPAIHPGSQAPRLPRPRQRARLAPRAAPDLKGGSPDPPKRLRAQPPCRPPPSHPGRTRLRFRPSASHGSCGVILPAQLPALAQHHLLPIIWLASSYRALKADQRSGPRRCRSLLAGGPGRCYGLGRGSGRTRG